MATTRNLPLAERTTLLEQSNIRAVTEQVNAHGWRSLLFGLLALSLAIVAGLGMARWLSRPLRELADAARRIRQGQLDLTLTAQGRDEIGVLTRAVADMARALRDRDFIRETFGRYVSPEVAEHFLRDRDALRLGGELRAVTILMSDLRGFSALSERLGPEAMIAVLNRYLARMTPVILEHGGLINEFIGDAILVLFGAPLARPDDTERAVRCARAMQQTLAALNAEHRRAGRPELAMGIGLHHGEVVAGNIGTAERVKYGVVGPAVNVAARLQALSGAGEIVASQAVVARAGADGPFGAATEVWLKGMRAPMKVFRLLPQPPR
jgi:class 3 adenylate cyclase